jgi:hypothetical protein
VRRYNRLLGRLLDPLCVTVRPPAASLPNLQSNIFKARSSLLLCAEQLPSQRSHFPDVSLDRPADITSRHVNIAVDGMEKSDGWASIAGRAK